MPPYVPAPRGRRAAGSWPPGWVVPAGSHVRRPVLPPSPGPRHYTTPARVPIGPYGFAQGTVGAGGAVILHVGPAGFNTSWSLAQAALTTTTGPADTATCALYAQPYGPPSQPWQVGQSYQAGGDQVGLAGIKLVTGEFLFAVWSGGHPGDIATLILSGVMTVLS